MSRYIDISLTDSVHIFENNNPLDFTVQFDPPHEFPEQWSVSLIEVYGLEAETDCVLDICANIVDIEPKYSQIQRLRRVFLKKGESKIDFPHLIYVNLNRQRVWRLRIFIDDIEGKIKKGRNVFMKLHFKQNSM